MVCLFVHTLFCFDLYVLEAMNSHQQPNTRRRLLALCLFTFLILFCNVRHLPPHISHIFTYLPSPTVWNHFPELARLRPCQVHPLPVASSETSAPLLGWPAFLAWVPTPLWDTAADSGLTFCTQTSDFRSFRSEMFNSRGRKKMKLFWRLQCQNSPSCPWERRAFPPSLHAYLTVERKD